MTRHGWGGYEMKMCWSIRRVLCAYQDGALGQRRSQRVARHLHACPACQRELLDLQRVTLVLRSLSGPSRPPEYWPWALLRLQEKLRHQPREPVRSSWLDYLRCSPEAPAQALVPVALVGMALFGTVTFLGLEDEAFVFFTSYLLPIVLQ
jgi:anti-sigma factor RsiW